MRFNIPNLLSLSRLIAVPFLLYLSWRGLDKLFLILLFLALITDFFDGYLARKWNQITQLGSRLDSIGDAAVYLTLPVCAYWLWPDLIASQTAYITVAIVGITLPSLVGIVKFGTMPSIHTRAAKFSAFALSSTAFIMFLFKITWPFQIAAIFQVFAAIETLAIMLIIPESWSDIPGFRQALREIARRRRKKKLAKAKKESL